MINPIENISNRVNDHVITCMLIAWVDSRRIGYNDDSLNKCIDDFVEFYNIEIDVFALRTRYYRIKNAK